MLTILMGCFLAIRGMGNDPIGLKLGVVNYDGGPCHDGEKSVREVEKLRFYDNLEGTFGCQYLESLGSDEVTMNLVSV